MKKNFMVMHTGRPYGPCEPIPEGAWKILSKHTTESAAWKKIKAETSHLGPNQWDDHYKVVGPNGECDQREFLSLEWCKRMERIWSRR